MLHTQKIKSESIFIYSAESVLIVNLENTSCSKKQHTGYVLFQKPHRCEDYEGHWFPVRNIKF